MGSAVWRIWLVILLVSQLIKLLILPTQSPCFSHNSLGEVRLTFVFLSYSVCMIFRLASCNNTSYFHLANPVWDSGKRLCFNMWDKPFLVFCSQTWHECIGCSAVWRRDWRPCVTVWRAILESKAKLLLLMRSLKHEIIQYHTSRFESHHPSIHKVVMYCICHENPPYTMYIVNVIFWFKGTGSLIVLNFTSLRQLFPSPPPPSQDLFVCLLFPTSLTWI